MSLVSLAIMGLTIGLAIGFSPTLISVVSAYTASMIGRKTKKQYYTLASLLFLTMFGLLVLFIASLLTTVLSNLSPIYSDSTNLIIAVLGVIIGTNLVRRYFWPKPLINGPISLKKALNDRTIKKKGIFNILVLAILSFLASINTVGITILLFSSYSVILGPSAIIWGLPFAIGLIIPLYFIIAVIAHGTKVSAVIAWKENNKNTMRLCSGLIIIFLSWLQLFMISTGEKIIL